jgi:hypothetical protein
VVNKVTAQQADHLSALLSLEYERCASRVPPRPDGEPTS